MSTLEERQKALAHTSSEIDASLEVLGETKATGDALFNLNLIYESLQRVKALLPAVYGDRSR